MPWFKVDDAFWGHKKLASLEAGPCFAEALALWTLAGSWCAQQLTDGRVPTAQLRKLVPFKADRAAAELVRADLWAIADGGFAFRDWTDYQPTAEQVKADRAVTRDRVKAWRNGKRNADGTEDVTPLHEAYVTPDVTGSVTPFVHEPTRARSPSPSPLPSERTTFSHSEAREDFGPGMSPNGKRAEALRAGYVARFKHHLPKVKPESRCGQPVVAWWLDLARELEDSDVSTLLDAAFADDFVRKSGFKTGAVASERVRLLAFGPTVNGEAKPPHAAPDPSTNLGRAQAARDAAEKALADARRHRDSLSGGDGHAEAVADFLRKQRALGDADDALEAAKRRVA